MNFLENKLVPFAAKLGSQRQLGAVRDAFILFMPLTIAAAFAVLINNVFLGADFGLANPAVASIFGGDGYLEVLGHIRTIFGALYNGTLGMIAFFIAMAIPYNLAKQSDIKNPLVVAFIVGAAFIALIAGTYVTVDPVAGAAVLTNYDVPGSVAIGVLNTGVYFGAANLFTSLVVGILFGELTIWLMGLKALQIKMPESVPPMVASAFSALFPAFISLTIAGIVAVLFQLAGPSIAGFVNGLFGLDGTTGADGVARTALVSVPDLSTFISVVIQQPILAFARTGVGGALLAFIYVFLSCFLWLFGIHGPNVLGGVSQPIFGVLQVQNIDLYAAGVSAYSDQMAIFSAGFFDAYCFMGGSGLTLGLIIAIFLFSKRADYKAIASFSVAPGLFNINEPIIFGMPIVLNPILGIPFVLAPMAAIILPWILTTIGILPKIVLSAPWVTPVGIGAFLMTGGNFLAALVALANVAISALIYIPFVIASNRELEVENEMADEEATA